MEKLIIKGKNYDIDHEGFLSDHTQWDRDFAEEMAKKVGISKGLSEAHWKVINFINEYYKRTGKCPLVYETCRANKLSLHDLKELFPTGYLRGACRVAGLSYREGYIKYSWPETEAQKAKALEEKVYHIDVRGFLIDPAQWDENYALNRALDMKIQGGLTEAHWRVIRFLHERFVKTGEVPTVYETCEALGLDLEELEKLFPDGYHRGAVKIAGLRVR